MSIRVTFELHCTPDEIKELLNNHAPALKLVKVGAEGSTNGVHKRPKVKTPAQRAAQIARNKLKRQSKAIAKAATQGVAELTLKNPAENQDSAPKKTGKSKSPPASKTTSRRGSKSATPLKEA
jgi:hypothetical protein